MKDEHSSADSAKDNTLVGMVSVFGTRYSMVSPCKALCHLIMSTFQTETLLHYCGFTAVGATLRVLGV